VAESTTGELLRYPPSVVLVVIEGDQVVLVRQHRPGSGRAVVELPAGKIEPGETAGEAASRELAEECGLAASNWRALGSFWAAPAYSTEWVTAFAATAAGARHAQPDADEQIEVVRVPIREAHRRVEDATSLAALALFSSSTPDKELTAT
jgi:ADP-ribose pyrophosphatase